MDEFMELLSRCKYEKLAVFEPEGNNGDKLILLGLEKALNELNISYRKYTPHFSIQKALPSKMLREKISQASKAVTRIDVPKKALDLIIELSSRKTNRSLNFKDNPASVFLINGGAHINDYYGHGTKLLEAIINQNPKGKIIVAPQTYWFRSTCFPKIFENTKQEIHLFCRERSSYCLLESMDLPSNVNIHLSPDTAFYLSRSDFTNFLNPTPRFAYGSYDLLCLRTDKESALTKDAVITKETILRKLQGHKLLIQDISVSTDFRDFVNIVECSRNVYTDRLHVAILAVIFDKKTYLFPNSYYKNHAIFDYSLQVYDSIKLYDSEPNLSSVF